MSPPLFRISPAAESLPVFPLAPIEVRRPELRADVCTLIGMVCHGHVDGQLLLPVRQLVKMFGVNVSPEFQAQLDERGDLRFLGDQFINEGPVIRREVRLRGMPADLEIASPLSGTVERGFDHFVLSFNPGASFRVGRFIFEAELARLSIDAERVVLELRPAGSVRVELTAGVLPPVS